MMDDIDRKMKSALPNKLTAFRLICIPLVVLFLSFDNKLTSFFADLFLCMSFITDIMDGYYARKYESVTALGKFLDPLADKILVAISMIMLIPLGRIPVLIVIVIIARELAVNSLRSMAVIEGIVIQASRLGKYKTIFQASAVTGLALHYEYFKVDFHIVGTLILWAALILTLWSGWDYFNKFNRLFSSERPPV
jgi:CDP-diacylglycerol--glycerol-3-phosphate 3-phosphatidyltransferase